MLAPAAHKENENRVVEAEPVRAAEEVPKSKRLEKPPSHHSEKSSKESKKPVLSNVNINILINYRQELLMLLLKVKHLLHAAFEQELFKEYQLIITYNNHIISQYKNVLTNIIINEKITLITIII